MQDEVACDRICDDISRLLLDFPPRSSVRAAYAAAFATHDLAAAFHHAAGLPEDPLWSEAVESLVHFLEVCDEMSVSRSRALLSLRQFVAENADLLAPRVELRRAS
jgi:hypothetical protein